MGRHTVAFALFLLMGLMPRVDSPRAAAIESDKRIPFELEIDFRIDEPLFFVGGPLPFALRLKLLPGAEATTIPSKWYAGAQIRWQRSRSVLPGGQITQVHALETTAMNSREKDSIVRLTPQKPGDAAYLVLPPEDTRAMSKGAHTLTATVEMPQGASGKSKAIFRLEQRVTFTMAEAVTREDKVRLCLMTATYQVENENRADDAVRTVENGLRETGAVELNERLGWLYQSRGEFKNAIGAYEKYIVWARASGKPRLNTGRGPQEIADTLEQIIPILRARLKNSPAPRSK